MKASIRGKARSAVSLAVSLDYRPWNEEGCFETALNVKPVSVPAAASPIWIKW